ncbi:porin [Alteromonas naphthalenivorans]|uniref:Porin family outer membrane protein n=1 Tax=Alteromonas naphthalenivorans TaxID=715451 RepID=F5Z817_ALTNA|nr:porin [Alteromonas naphthalenivorans]AEF03210.1 porin family outer membrane protein [Alteromonas naphthalenivorans]
MYKIFLPTLCLSFCSFATTAQPSYSFLQAGFVKTEIADLESFNLNGYELRASAEIGYGFFAEYKHTDSSDSLDGFKLETLQRQFSIGYIHNISPQMTLDYRLGLGNFDMTGTRDNDSASADTDYFSVATNLRYQLTADVEVFGGLEVQNWDGDADQKAYRLGAQYDLWGFLTGIEYTKYSDQEIVNMSIRYAF